MTDVQLDDLRAALETERADLVSQLATLGVGDAAEEMVYDANFADSSQVTAEKGETTALAATLQESLDAVEEALSRMDEGSYGTCKGCSTAITPARLEAMPSSTLCIDCASRA
jgi:DnaK suppressor protein